MQVNLNLSMFVIVAHDGQTDKSGLDYYEHHLLPVARSVPPRLYYAALAHDILEDTPTTRESMLKAGFSPREVELIEILTKRNEPYVNYLHRVKQDTEATHIKLMDIVNNMSKLGNLSDEDTKHRLYRKYRMALTTLLG